MAIDYDDELILVQQDMWTLAEWWQTLNCWGWPDELPNPEPSEYIEGGRRHQIMGWIIKRVGYRVCNRAGNKDMTDEEHNDFWRGNFEGDADAKARYQQRVLTKIMEQQDA